MTAPQSDVPISSRISSQKLVIAVHDLHGYTRAAATADDLAVATFMDEYYVLCAELVHAGGGRVVKFVGDACLAVFPPERCADAVDAVRALRARVPALAHRHHLPVAPGTSNVHLAVVAAGELGPAGDRRFDVLGAGVNHTFLLGARQGPGVHVSEPVYRALPNERRTPWRKAKPPAVYTLDD